MRRNKECHSACKDDKRANEPSTNQGHIIHQKPNRVTKEGYIILNLKLFNTSI